MQSKIEALEIENMTLIDNHKVIPIEMIERGK